MSYADNQWLKEANARLPAPAREWRITGFPDYVVYHGPRVWHRTHADARGHVRRAREVEMTCKSGCFGFTLRRNGCAVWVGKNNLRRLLTLAE